MPSIRLPKFHDDIDSYSETRFALVGDVHGWRLVRLGLAMHYGGMLALSIAMAIGVVFGICAFSSRTSNDALLAVVTYGLLGAVAVSYFVACVGQFLCCAVPPESGAKGVAIASCACLAVVATGGGVWFLLGLIGRRDVVFLEMARFPDHLFLFAIALVYGAHIADNILFVLFVRNIARNFRFFSLSVSATDYLGWYAALSAAYPLASLAGAFSVFLLGLGCVLWFFLLVAGLVMLVLYLTLIGRARDLVGDALREAD